jgi:hypothetical protein
MSDKQDYVSEKSNCLNRETSPKSKVRYAVVGLGYIAQVAVLPAFAHAKENSELVALVSGDAMKLKKLARKYKISTTYSYEQYADCLASREVASSLCELREHCFVPPRLRLSALPSTALSSVSHRNIVFLKRPMVGLAKWFDPMAGKVYGMFYQNDSPYLFDSSRFAKAFGFTGTPMAQ